ncbi:MAG: hypothetical protein P8182_17600, partial [Deltaproteobacteria bacterium]
RDSLREEQAPARHVDTACRAGAPKIFNTPIMAMLVAAAVGAVFSRWPLVGARSLSREHIAGRNDPRLCDDEEKWRQSHGAIGSVTRAPALTSC